MAKLTDEFLDLLIENGYCITAPAVVSFFNKNRSNKEFVEKVKIWLINIMIGPGC